jgi:dipeptidyl aminopeptidase/acylaminoacyl peptidase
VRDTPPNPFVRTLAGTETRLARLPRDIVPTSVSPDGRSFLAQMTDATTGSDLWLFSTASGTPPTAFLRTPFNEQGAQISPDGHWVAFFSDESGRNEVYITAFPTPGRQVRVSADGGSAPRWRNDGSELFFQAKSGLMAVSVAADPAAATGLRVGLPRLLFDLPKDAGAWLPAHDGQRFLVNVQMSKGVPAPVTVMLNWQTAIGR